MEKITFTRSSHPEILKECRETYDLYCRDLGLTEKDFRGKQILDVASGKPYFETYLKYKNPSAKVYSVDIRPFLGITAQANWERLPFTDKTFDLVLSRAGVTLFPDKGFIRGMRELIRVTRKGGEVRIGVLTKGISGTPARIEADKRQWIELFKLLTNMKRRKAIRVEVMPVGARVVEQDEEGNPVATEEGYCIRISKL